MESAFEHLTGFSPLKWQKRLYAEYFVQGRLPAAVDIPTGLGKTAVMALWLIARGEGAALPRRLVYVVDRRAVVDQATGFAERLRDQLNKHRDALAPMVARLGLPRECGLPISTLRGQHVDNRTWLEDPSACAIVVGTVDMIGSRLLFEGYGVSRKMRPYHAGLLGSDTVVVLDEAHLVPPFEGLLRSIETDGAWAPRTSGLIPSFRLLPLSATGREQSGEAFCLVDEDVEGDGEAQKRLFARKRLQLRGPVRGTSEKLAQRLAHAAWELAGEGAAPVRCLVFCDRRDVASQTEKALKKLAKGDKEVELFVGARRVREREKAAERLRELGFLADSERPPRAAFLVATSAAEVGVDLDADHMVCDLVPWERMVQRLGRINRRGNTKVPAEIHVVVEASVENEPRSVVRLLTEHVPRTESAIDVSPEALRRLKAEATRESELAELLAKATSPVPLRPALSRAVLEAWAMTSLADHTGRPEVAPWLRGWVDDLPQTRVVWRKHLPLREGEQLEREIGRFFEAAPPHATEVLETETHRVLDWLVKRAQKLTPTNRTRSAGLPPVAVCVLDSAGKYLERHTWAALAKVKAADKKRWQRQLAGKTLVVDARMAGLREGLLDEACDDEPRTLDDERGWPVEGQTDGKVVPYRVRRVSPADSTEDAASWCEVLRFYPVAEDESPEYWLQVEKHSHAGNLEEHRSVARKAQGLQEHQDWAAEEARTLAARLGLPAEFTAMLVFAARLHDEGKRAERWQRAFRAPKAGGPYAKTRGPLDMGLLHGYRHEFGSLPHAEGHPEFAALRPDLQDLALHLIAAHHGQARPVIVTDGCEDAPRSALEARAREVALRFARLQAHWGPWGLAYWEALLRAADQRASRRNDNSSGGDDGAAGGEA